MRNRTIIPLTPHTGGVLDPHQVIGREEVIEKYWEILQGQGIVLYAERRFGKSAVLTMMRAEDRKDYLSIYIGVEGVVNADKFVEKLFDSVLKAKLFEESNLKKIENTFNSITSYIPKAGPLEFKAKDKKWEKQFNYLLTSLVEQRSEKYIVIMLDEFTIMLDKMDEPEAVNILGYLRDLVQHDFFEKLRFVYCGSIGIDLVLDKLKRAGHNMGDPINHMSKQRLLPFTEEEALFFCKCLNEGCELKLLEDIMKSICDLVDRIPYFIDKVFDKIRYYSSIDESEINKALNDILDDPSDTNNFKHFYDRIDNFYPNKIITNHILNYLSKIEEYTSEDVIADHINHQMKVDRKLSNDEIDRLWRDGYLKREIIDSKRNFKFNYSIIKKWWLINKAY
ncbi:MAG: ATP-binding protein [Bacteroidetes bacterium]|nr:ATP-binding protein [Bacteroidota bacterium]